jgi:hypothetical protein
VTGMLVVDGEFPSNLPLINCLVTYIASNTTDTFRSIILLVFLE